MDLENNKDNTEILNFVVARLLNYKRINYDILVETLKLRFSSADVNGLLNKALIETNAAMIQNEHIMLSNKEKLLSLDTGAIGLN